MQFCDTHINLRDVIDTNNKSTVDYFISKRHCSHVMSFMTTPSYPNGKINTAVFSVEKK